MWLRRGQNQDFSHLIYIDKCLNSENYLHKSSEVKELSLQGVALLCVLNYCIFVDMS